jgi:ribosomal protein S18 acetylase RimI-like enzyme
VGSGIRDAVESDVAELVAEDFGPEGLYRDRLRLQHAGKGRLLIYRLDPAGPPDGVVFLWLDEAEEEEVRTRLPNVPLIMHLKVHQGRRGCGIGTELMHEAGRIAVAAGRTQIALGVDPSNHSAIELYKRLGYVEWPYGLVDTHQVEFRQRRRRRYNEKCLIFVKPLSTVSARGELQSLAAAHGVLD